MTSLNNADPYNVRETEQFDAEWRRAVRLGYINPMADPAILMQIREQLAQNPYHLRRIRTAPFNVRRVALNPATELWYTIIEDDRTVWLESVRIIGQD